MNIVIIKTIFLGYMLRGSKDLKEPLQTFLPENAKEDMT